MERSEILARLYNHAKPLGMGFLHYDPTPMTREEARALLEAEDRPESPYYPDYLKGRVMKIKILADTAALVTHPYERDNGPGSVLEALTCPGCARCKTGP